MKIAVVRDPRFLEHKTGHTHPENPARLRAVYRLLDREFNRDLIQIHPEPATLEQLELVHTPVYIEKVLKTADHDASSLALQTPTSAQTYLAAWLAAGGCISGIEALMNGTCDVCFCMVRPPGHHALADRAGGFCIFNNLAIAARYAIQTYGLERVLIIDWDVHHGNGIQQIFYGDPTVFYFSTHDAELFPFSGDWTETGMAPGAGFTLNVPLPRQISDSDLIYLYWHILAPLFTAYQPQLILVSAGFDAHQTDPIGRCNLQTALYGHLTELILDLRPQQSPPPILFSLEGGYDPSALTECIREVMQVLIDHNGPRPAEPHPTPLGVQLLEAARNAHRPFNLWTRSTPSAAHKGDDHDPVKTAAPES